MSESKKLILYIEDEPEMVDLVRLILSREGHTVVGTNVGSEGFELAQQLTPDLILLDLAILEMDGLELYWKLQAKKQTRAIPIIVIATKRPNNVDQVLFLTNVSVENYLIRPFTPQELLNYVERILA